MNARGEVGYGIAALSALLLCGPGAASAQGVAVVRRGCELEGAVPPSEILSAALALELTPPLTTVPTLDDAQWIAELTVEGCDDESAEVLVRGPAGERRGPIVLDLSVVARASRPRVIAIFLAEWLDDQVRSGTSESVPPTEGDQGPAGNEATEATPTEATEAELVAPAAAETEAPEPDSAPGALLGSPRRPSDVRVRFVGLGTFRHAINMPATYGGLQLGAQVASRGAVGIAGEAAIGAEGGLHWNRRIVALHASLTGFLVLFDADGIELAVGPRVAVNWVAYYDRTMPLESLGFPVQGLLFGVARGSVEIVPGVDLALDLEAGGALAPIEHSYDDFVVSPPFVVEALFEGFMFGARLGVLIE